MEFLIYDHECPTKSRDFTDIVPWISVVLSLYITVKFLVKLMDTSFETQIETLINQLKTLEVENDELTAKVDSLEREREHMDEVVKALVDKFVKEGHPLTKVD